MPRPATPSRRRPDDRGSTTVSVIVAVGVVLVLVVAIIQVIVFQYGKGTVRAALDEGVRAGSRSDTSIATCQERAAAVLTDLLGGSLGDGVRVACRDDGDRVVATADVHFDGWLGGVSDYDATITASAAKEDR